MQVEYGAHEEVTFVLSNDKNNYIIKFYVMNRKAILKACNLNRTAPCMTLSAS